MEATDLHLTPAQRQALLSHPNEPVHIADEQTRKVYLLIEEGAIPELEEEYVRARLEEGFAASDRGEEEEWDSAAIKADGRRILEERRSN